MRPWRFCAGAAGRLALVILLGVCLVSAAARAQQQSTPKPEPSSVAEASSSYILSPNDQVLIEVFQEDDLRTNTLISKDGSIDFPLIGNVKIGGLSQGQARDKITSMLERRFLVSPQVSLSVIKFASKRFTVLGEVARPGTYDIPDTENIDLLEAIAMAGGFTKISASTRVVIKRTVDSREEVHTEDARRMSKDPRAPRFIVLPGDTITIPQSLF